jgi:hypothetical protein
MGAILLIEARGPGAHRLERSRGTLDTRYDDAAARVTLAGMAAGQPGRAVKMPLAYNAVRLRGSIPDCYMCWKGCPPG